MGKPNAKRPLMKAPYKSAQAPAPSAGPPPATGSHIEVIATDPADHPHCERHGPAILFRERFDDPQRPAQQFYGCSANRDRHQCRVLHTTPTTDPESIAAAQRALQLAYEQRLAANAARLAELRKLPADKRAFCGQCSRLLLPTELAAHCGHSALQRTVSDLELRCPTRLLAPLDNDQREAQYFFADTALATIVGWLRSAQVRRIICIGAPRLHEHLRQLADGPAIASVLLDLDDRLEQFYGRHEMFRFNMFNGWWADGAARGDEFDEFLQADASPPLIFTDPPFGCRTEPLAQTLRSLQQRHAHLHRLPSPAAPSPIIWVFPYFMATYIERVAPQLRASAYAVNYTNHAAYRPAAAGGRKLGSPIRLFTNLPDAMLPLPAAEGYGQCARCNGRWQPAGIEHCVRCDQCAASNGAHWRHCGECATCVKPSYVHCDRCGRCVQRAGHVCEMYEAHVWCWICRRQGHAERRCRRWLQSAAGAKVWRKWCLLQKKAATAAAKKAGERTGRMCLVCGRSAGHNEKNCKERAARLGEWCFGGEIFNVFSEDCE